MSFELRDEQRLMPSSFNQIGLPGGIGWPTGGSRRPGIPQIPSSSGGNAPSVRTEIFITTRWASALPVRQAMALQQFGKDGLDSEQAIELLKGSDSEYVLEVAGFPATIIRQGAEKLEAELLKTARVSVSGRSSISAVSAVTPPHGMHLMSTLRFARIPDLSPDKGTIEFTAEPGVSKLRERFKLKDMVYAGRLEL